MTWKTAYLVLLVIAAVISVLTATPALTVTANQETVAQDVTVGAGDIIVSEAVAVWRRFNVLLDRYALYLTLDELRPDGSVVSPGKQIVLMADTSEVFEPGAT